MTAPASLVLPTPVLSEVPSLAWPTIRAPQGPAVAWALVPPLPLTLGSQRYGCPPFHDDDPKCVCRRGRRRNPPLWSLFELLSGWDKQTSSIKTKASSVVP